MTCNWTEKLNAFHDGELPPETRAELTAHLAACPACAAEVERLRRTARFLKAAEMPSMNSSGLARLRSRIGAERLNGRRVARLAGWLHQRRRRDHALQRRRALLHAIATAQAVRRATQREGR